jgi:hypothetical protein
MSKWAGYSVKTSSVDLAATPPTLILGANPRRKFVCCCLPPANSGTFFFGKPKPVTPGLNNVVPVEFVAIQSTGFTGSFKADFSYYGQAMQGEIWCQNSFAGPCKITEIVMNTPFQSTVRPDLFCRPTSWRAWQGTNDPTVGPLQLISGNSQRFAIVFNASFNVGIPRWSFGTPDTQGGNFITYADGNGLVGYDNIGDMISQPLFIEGTSVHTARVVELFHL